MCYIQCTKHGSLSHFLRRNESISREQMFCLLLCNRVIDVVEDEHHAGHFRDSLSGKMLITTSHLYF